MTLEKNIEDVLDRVERAAIASNRNPEEVKLIAVTKTVDIDIMKRAIEYGIVHVGENKVQELVRKYEAIGPVVKWHLIGHLQRNKVKYIIDKVDLIHSLDSYRLAEEIDKRAKEINRVVECLLQVNVSGEESKYGISVKGAKELLKEIVILNNVKIVGLMTMAPHVENQEETRQYFSALKTLSEEISEIGLENVEMKYLSMGMSNDFEIAIEEGASLIRVGSSIFGERDYSK
ncbi:YggS family pyridoxal phosphate-dependent enzyme [Alkaliphilus sp. MSJ-5]|uniref:Pyridoxal phosphate homeostasis protein n=1 Tax=Alkaliphilus flagellatus TaxID=2841507 RepID=A0ABS6G4C9_9FIRM|nr:YggS family pyridoxal phosphate-dependent enzyme [Alkaliphilus flagellatus]MBU5677337.1 YggS family pyridoxal phosphate-dependent enzyme [Alkaliphilus flagellatus]